MTTEVAELSTQQLEAMLKERKAKENKARLAAKSKYEKKRDRLVSSVLKSASRFADQLAAFKAELNEAMEEQYLELQEYGELRSNSQGGFSITHTDGTLRVTRRRDTEPYWDERSQKAMELIKDFLHDAVKKRDEKMFNILIGFLERNKAGELEYSRVFHLLRHEDSFDDPRWVEGLRLLKEGYNVNLKGYGYEFKVKGEDGKWDSLTLNFSAL